MEQSGTLKIFISLRGPTDQILRSRMIFEQRTESWAEAKTLWQQWREKNPPLGPIAHAVFQPDPDYLG